MRLQVFLTVLEIAVIVLVLGYFLNKVANLLNSISKTLSRVAFGVRAVETMCLVIGPGARKLNASLTQVAGGLEGAAGKAERLAG